MDMDTFMDMIYTIYEENGCDGSIPVKVTFYSSGDTHERDMHENDIEFVDGKLLIKVEDN